MARNIGDKCSYPNLLGKPLGSISTFLNLKDTPITFPSLQHAVKIRDNFLSTNPLIWNKLGSDAEVETLEYGPSYISKAGILYETGIYNNGARCNTRGTTDGLIYEFPTGYNINAGCIEFWINFKYDATYTNWSQICGQRQSTSESYADCAYNRSYSTANEVIIRCHMGYATGRNISIGVIDAGEWHHVASVWDVNGINGDTDKLYAVYLDGVEKGSYSTFTAATPVDTDYYGILTNYNPDTDASFESNEAALIDNFKLWNFAKTDFSDRFFEAGGGTEDGIDFGPPRLPVNIQSTAFTAQANTAYYIQGTSSRIKVSLASGMEVGDKIIIQGTDDAEWYVDCGVRAPMLYKKFLASSGSNRAVQLLSLGSGSYYIAKIAVGSANIAQYGNLFGGFDGSTYYTTVEYIDMTLYTVNAKSRATLTLGRASGSAVMGVTTIYFGGGDNTTRQTQIDSVDAFDLSAAITSDVADLTVAKNGHKSVAGIKLGFFCGGNSGSATNLIDYIDLLTQSVGSAGGLTEARQWPAGVNSSKYGFLCGGHTGTGYTSTIDYIDLFAAYNNCVDRGELTVARQAAEGVSGQTFGFIAGGEPGNDTTIDKLDLLSLSTNSSDRGDMLTGRYCIGGVSGSRFGFFAGGLSPYTANIEFLDTTVLDSINNLSSGSLAAAARAHIAGA